MKTSPSISLVAGALALVWTANPASAEIQTFDGVPAGTVVAGEMPGGGMAPGSAFPDFTLSVANHGTGPHSAVVFDSSAPTGGDTDLGTPNESCGGPGVGPGGAEGTPGENCVALGNLLIIAEDLTDVSPTDGLVDDPDDEALGGSFTFEFQSAIQPVSITIVDIDFESATVDLVMNGQATRVHAEDLGNNSVQVLDLTGHGLAESIVVTISSSGAVGGLEYLMKTSPVESESWGSIKEEYR